LYGLVSSGKTNIGADVTFLFKASNASLYLQVQVQGVSFLVSS